MAPVLIEETDGSEILPPEELEKMFRALDTEQLQYYIEKYLGIEKYELCAIIKKILEERAQQT
jgi:hypothetical protein